MDSKETTDKKYKLKYSAQELENKLDKVNQEYSLEEKEKLNDLKNYDDSQIKSDINTLSEDKLDKNQGSENSGKVLGTNANGEVIPLNGYGFEYDEKTKMLKYGTDPTSNLNQGIGLDDTLSKKGYAADAGAVGELKEDLAQLDFTYEWSEYELTGLNDISNYTAGGISSAGDSTNSHYMRNETDFYFVIPQNKRLKITSNSQQNKSIAIVYYDENKNYVKTIGDVSSNASLVTEQEIENSYSYFRIVFGYWSSPTVHQAHIDELVPLLKCYQHSVVCGLKRNVNSNTEKIYTLEQKMGELPDYYLDELSRVQNEILNNLSYNSVIFGVFTDIHYNSSGDNAESVNNRQINAMRKIADSLPLDFTLDGGDLLTYCTHDYSKKIINQSIAAFSGCRIPHFIAKGDHDSAQTDTKISKTEWAARTYPYMKDVVFCEEEKNNYYYDIPNKKTRFICLDTGTAFAGDTGTDMTSDFNKTIDWLLNDVFTDDVKNGWRFILFSHAPLDYEWNVGMVKRGSLSSVRLGQIAILQILDALNSSTIYNQPIVEQESKNFYRDENGVLTQDTSKSVETYICTRFSVAHSKDFSGWTSKVKLTVSGHCHCDRLNKRTNGIDKTYAIAYTAASSYNGFKSDDYYVPCFGTDGLIAHWNNIENRSIGNISEALMDIYIVSDDIIKKIRFGIGSDYEISL